MDHSLLRPLGSLLVIALVCCALVSADPAPVGSSLPAALPPPADRPIDFVKDIKPLFESACIQCHAKGKDKGGFSLETRAALLKGGDDGAAVVVGHSAESVIVKMVAAVDPDSVMPKKGSRWSAKQVGLLRAWIDQGMPWDESITFARPAPRNFAPRDVALPAGAGNPVDRLLAAYFKAKDMPMPAVVEDRLFVRRAYLDTIGLLPTPEQLQAFIDDSSADKRGELVRKLLTDNRGYADHWLTFWNDLLRNDYKGTGFIDGGRRQITGWLYASLASNKPYDRFVAELVNPGKGSEGFSRGIIWRGAVNSSQLPPMQAAQNISQVFMGVNLKCASCHDSFVSDWTLADCYGLAAVYSDDTLEMVHCDKPTGKTSAPRFLYPEIGSIAADAPRSERLAELATLIISRQDGRLSRTIVNRLWAKLLGRGLVEPLDDMEKQAWSADLLDWLAEDLVAHQYDLKHTIETILTSQAYQLPTVEVAEAKAEYVFRGPQTRRLTAEQFCDALTALGDSFPRMPATLQFDFSGGGIVSVAPATWIWTDEPVEAGQRRAVAMARKSAADSSHVPTKATIADIAAPGEQANAGHSGKSKALAKFEPPRRHRVAFRSTFELVAVPREAYAVLGATQSASLWINGKEVHPMMSETRVAMFDVRDRLKMGANVVVLDVASHTEKGNLNDLEKENFPAALNHLNQHPGVAFYLRARVSEQQWVEVVTDSKWLTRRSPDGKWKEDAGYDVSKWREATPLPPGVAPIDEAGGLEPIVRKDFANEPLDVSLNFHSATTTAAQPGGIRAALLVADPLMTALDRPNREQVMTSRSTAATTLQALALTNGSALDARLKAISVKLAPLAAKDPDTRVTQLYVHILSRPPTEVERKLSLDAVGDPVKPEGVADLLWGLTMMPEFQFVN